LDAQRIAEIPAYLAFLTGRIEPGVQGWTGQKSQVHCTCGGSKNTLYPFSYTEIGNNNFSDPGILVQVDYRWRIIHCKGGVSSHESRGYA
jgi:hypothetical protein